MKRLFELRFLMDRRTSLALMLMLISMIVAGGCGTTTNRLATQQLLLSDAVDHAVGEIDFSYLSDKDIYLDTKYLQSIQGTAAANTDYIVSSIRQQLSLAGCRVQELPENADIIVEPRVGVLGTDGHEVTYGIPQAGQLASAAAALTAAPVVPAIPEISFGRSDEQLAIAKIVLFAYDRETKVALWQSGVRKSESTSSNTWVLGAGPFQKGSVYEGVRFAGKKMGEDGEVLDDETVIADVDSIERDEEAEKEPEVEPAKRAEQLADASKNDFVPATETQIR